MLVGALRAAKRRRAEGCKPMVVSYGWKKRCLYGLDKLTGHAPWVIGAAVLVKGY